jgi:hypothetical protein
MSHRLFAAGALLLAAVGCGHGAGGGASARNPWKVVESAHFLVHTDAEPADYAPVIERLEDVHEALSATYFDGVPVARVDALLFAKQRDFAAVAPENLTGFYSTQVEGFADGLMVFSSEGDLEAVGATAAHELAHRFLQELSDRVPIWLHEGFAKYVGALRVYDDLVAFDVAPVSGAYLHVADPVPLERLFSASTSDFHGASARAQYLSAWMLVRQMLARRALSGDRFQRLVAESVLARSPAAQLALVSAAMDAPAAEIAQDLEAVHAAIATGGHPPVRTTLAVRLQRRARSPLRVAPADPEAVRALLAALRRGSEP